MLQALLNWVDDRTGVVTGLKGFLDEKVPASSGWHQVFGSVALFILLTQFATGVLLALNFAPQPGVSYLSLQYIVNEIPGGRLIRGLHHWGASMMVVIVVLHMIQVAIWGAYKKPREVTWIVGILLLLLTLGFGLTGYLLPWDNRAYWATMVTVQISGLPPGGAIVQSLMGSPDGQVGIGAFQRFYTMHVMVLPAITLALALFHVVLVRRHGVAPQPGDERQPKKNFYPEQVFKDTVAVFGTFGVLFGLALFADIPMEKLADPQDLSYVPRPEWYFLFLFQMLKYFEGAWEVVGAVILPTLAVIALMLVPFFDRGEIKRVSQRFLAMGTVVVAALLWSGLTVAALMSTPDNELASGSEVEADAEWTSFPPTALAGLHEFRQLECAQCHNIAGGDPKVGPDISRAMNSPDEEEMAQHFADPAAVGKQRELSPLQTQSLTALVGNLTPENGTAIADSPELPVYGARVYAAQHCGACHLLNGEGQRVGPPLNGVGQRRDAAWLTGHFREPSAFVEGSTMPPFPLPDAEMEALVAYMLALKN